MDLEYVMDNHDFKFKHNMSKRMRTLGTDMNLNMQRNMMNVSTAKTVKENQISTLEELNDLCEKHPKIKDYLKKVTITQLATVARSHPNSVPSPRLAKLKRAPGQNSWVRFTNRPLGQNPKAPINPIQELLSVSGLAPLVQRMDKGKGRAMEPFLQILIRYLKLRISKIKKLNAGRKRSEPLLLPNVDTITKKTKLLFDIFYGNEKRSYSEIWDLREKLNDARIKFVNVKPLKMKVETRQPLFPTASGVTEKLIMNICAPEYCTQADSLSPAEMSILRNVLGILAQLDPRQIEETATIIRKLTDPRTKFLTIWSNVNDSAINPIMSGIFHSRMVQIDVGLEETFVNPTTRSGYDQNVDYSKEFVRKCQILAEQNGTETFEVINDLKEEYFKKIGGLYNIPAKAQRHVQYLRAALQLNVYIPRIRGWEVHAQNSTNVEETYITKDVKGTEFEYNDWRGKEYILLRHRELGIECCIHVNSELEEDGDKLEKSLRVHHYPYILTDPMRKSLSEFMDIFFRIHLAYFAAPFIITPGMTMTAFEAEVLKSGRTLDMKMNNKGEILPYFDDSLKVEFFGLNDRIQFIAYQDGIPPTQYRIDGDSVINNSGGKICTLAPVRIEMAPVGGGAIFTSKMKTALINYISFVTSRPIEAYKAFQTNPHLLIDDPLLKFCRDKSSVFSGPDSDRVQMFYFTEIRKVSEQIVKTRLKPGKKLAKLFTQLIHASLIAQNNMGKGETYQGNFNVESVNVRYGNPQAVGMYFQEDDLVMRVEQVIKTKREAIDEAKRIMDLQDYKRYVGNSTNGVSIKALDLVRDPGILKSRDINKHPVLFIVEGTEVFGRFLGYKNKRFKKPKPPQEPRVSETNMDVERVY